MSLKDQSTLRVVLYEGDGAQALDASERFTAMTALLERGYSVTRTTTRGNVAAADRTSLLVLGKFGSSTPAAEDASGNVAVQFRNLDQFDAQHVADLVETERTQRGAVRQGEWKPWFPV